ncbi:uncharacterized protein G2W53_033321 [Senna tora]|uniref:Uncharacterized protein n=1 Tax=Senna tora TaxID=362788 RepID=A0A834W6W8_9FABA|nr:uncharacterized protein G2W53_033321 [Senna tora]
MDNKLLNLKRNDYQEIKRHGEKLLKNPRPIKTELLGAPKMTKTPPCAHHSVMMIHPLKLRIRLTGITSSLPSNPYKAYRASRPIRGRKIK